MELYHELTVHATGNDDGADLAWFKALLADCDDRRCVQVRRAAAHWQAASEPLRDALAAKLGISEPLPNAGLAWPVADAIAQDYMAAVAFAEHWLAASY